MAAPPSRLPQRRLIPLAPLVDELADLTGLAPGAAIAFEAEVADGLMIDADADQLSRILVNLVRNAVQALSQAGATEGAPRIVVAAEREGGQVVDHASRTTAPACPERARGEPLLRLPGLRPQRRHRPRPRHRGRARPPPRRHDRARRNRAAGACFRVVIPDRSRGERG